MGQVPVLGGRKGVLVFDKDTLIIVAASKISCPASQGHEEGGDTGEFSTPSAASLSLESREKLKSHVKLNRLNKQHRR